MEKNHLFEGEEIVLQSDNKLVVLTTRRIRYNNSQFGKAHIVSILLEKVSSIEIHYKSWLFMLLLGIFSIAAALVAGSQNKGEVMTAGIIIGLLFVVVYFITRKHIISIASCGGAKINFHTRGMSREKLMDFINKIELAKSKL